MTFTTPCVATVLAFAMSIHVPSFGQQAKPTLTVNYERPLRNARYPELLYWYVTPTTLAPQQYLKDIKHISEDTRFDFPFLTEREGTTFSDSPATHDAIKAMTAAAHAAHLRLGMTIDLRAVDTHRTFDIRDDQTVISSAEAVLDSRGAATVTPFDAVRFPQPVKTELLRAIVFRKAGEGEYEPDSYHDVTAATQITARTKDTVSARVALGPQYSGYTLAVFSTTWYNALDLFSDAYQRWVHEALDQYKDVPLDGTSLDEFSYMRLPVKPTAPWRGHFGGDAFRARFETITGMSFEDTIVQTRYVSAGHSDLRVRAINVYWDFLRQGPLQVEQTFYAHSRELFGTGNFAGIHDTFHNHLTNDEAWATGLNWWAIPREFGQSDENLSFPMRMGLLVSHPGAVMYNQWYSFDLRSFLERALMDARFGGRQHYHAYNDTGRYGVNLASPDFAKAVNPVEDKIRLLNRFDPAPPALPLLVIFGTPALLNWYPDAANRNVFDLNDGLHIEEKVQEIWDAGYRCAVVPSDLIDKGSLKLDRDNRPTLNGHVFKAVVYLYPEYSKRSTLAFLQTYVSSGGSLMLEGSASRDFDGNPIQPEFARISRSARVTRYAADLIPQLGVEPYPLAKIGGTLEDGTVVLTDLASIQSGIAKPFTVKLANHTFAGSYIGLLALKVSANGALQKMACGGCTSLHRDGAEILHLQKPADTLIVSTGAESFQAIVAGESGNQLTLRQER